jgi:hypothetical protein
MMRHTCVRFHVTVAATALLLHAHAARAQASPSPESVRRLPPAAFSELPAAVRRDLERRSCSIPQPWSVRAASNVVRGSFIGAKTPDWAVLCSVRDTSQILIYGSSSSGPTGVIDSLERAADVAWMQGIGQKRWGYSRLLRRLPLKRIRGWRRDADGKAIPQPIDHDAIEQIFMDKAADAFYLAAGRLYRQVTAD